MHTILPPSLTHLGLGVLSRNIELGVPPQCQSLTSLSLGAWDVCIPTNLVLPPCLTSIELIGNVIAPSCASIAASFAAIPSHVTRFSFKAFGLGPFINGVSDVVEAYHSLLPRLTRLVDLEGAMGACLHRLGGHQHAELTALFDACLKKFGLDHRYFTFLFQVRNTTPDMRLIALYTAKLPQPIVDAYLTTRRDSDYLRIAEITCGDMDDTDAKKYMEWAFQHAGTDHLKITQSLRFPTMAWWSPMWVLPTIVAERVETITIALAESAPLAKFLSQPMPRLKYFYAISPGGSLSSPMSINTMATAMHAMRRNLPSLAVVTHASRDYPSEESVKLFAEMKLYERDLTSKLLAYSASPTRRVLKCYPFLAKQ
jgi:hypothetical protein